MVYTHHVQINQHYQATKKRKKWYKGKKQNKTLLQCTRKKIMVHLDTL